MRLSGRGKRHTETTEICETTAGAEKVDESCVDAQTAGASDKSKEEGVRLRPDPVCWGKAVGKSWEDVPIVQCTLCTTAQTHCLRTEQQKDPGVRSLRCTRRDSRDKIHRYQELKIEKVLVIFWASSNGRSQKL